MVTRRGALGPHNEALASARGSPGPSMGAEGERATPRAARDMTCAGATGVSGNTSPKPSDRRQVVFTQKWSPKNLRSSG